jgi:hypothetical protein
VKQQMGKRFAAQGDRHPFHPGEIAEADLTGLIRQREHHLRRRAMEGLPVLHPPLQGAFHRTPVLIWLLLLQMLQQRGGSERWMALQQRQEQRFPHLGQWVGSASAAGLGGFGLEATCINAVGTAHRDARRCGSHLLAAAGSSFGHVQRNLLSGEGSRHDPVPCAWHPVSADPLRSGQPDRRDPSTRLSSDTKRQPHRLCRGASGGTELRRIGCFQLFPRHQGGEEHPAVLRIQCGAEGTWNSSIESCPLWCFQYICGFQQL